MKSLNFQSCKFLFIALMINFFSSQQTFAQTCSILGDTTVCENEVVVYSTTTTGAGYTYQWNAFGGTSVGSGTSINVTWGTPGAGQVTLVVRNNLNQIVCSGVLNVIIYSAPKPFIIPSINAKCGQPDTVKSGTPVQGERTNECFSVCDSTWITYSVINHPGSTYVWTITGSAIVIPSITNSIQVYWTGVGAGTVRVTETNAQGCIGIDEICVKIVAKPNASFTSMPAASGGIINACLNQSIQFINTSTLGGGSPFWSYTWVWGDGNTTVLGGLTNGNATHAYSIANTYNVMLIVENECHCKDTAFVTVVVSSTPGPDIQCVSTVCPGATVTYSTSVSCPNYLWTAVNGTIIGSNTSQSVTVQWGSVGPAYLTVQTIGCPGACPSPTTVEIPIIVPNATITGPNLVCLNECYTYHISCNIPIDSIKWNSAPGMTFISDSINEHEVKVCFFNPAFVSGNITATYFHKTPGAVPSLTCGGSSSLLVNQRPKLMLNYPSQICDLTVLSGTHNTMPSGNITWTITPAGSPFPVNTSTQSANIPFNPFWVWGPGTFTITATDLSNNYCDGPKSFILKVNPIPAPPDSIVGANLVCPNTPYMYLGFATASNLSLQWTITGGTPSTASGPFVSVLWGPGPSYGISLRQVDPITGCISNPINFAVNSTLPLVPSVITGPTTACANSLATNAYTTTTPGTNFSWSISPPIAGSITSGNNTPTVSVQWNNWSGLATITLVRTQCGQTISTNYNVTINAPAPPLISVPSPVCQGALATMSSATPGATFAWNFGDGGTGAGSPVNHTYNSAGIFIVTLTATYTGTCTGSATATANIQVNPKPTVTISTPNPNIFCGPVGTVNMFVASPAILTTYQWFRVPSILLASGTSYATNVIGNYYAVATNTFGCKDSSNIIPIDTLCDTCKPNSAFTVGLNIIKLGCNKDSFVGTYTPGASSPLFTFNDPFGSPNTFAGTNTTHTFPQPGYYNVKFCVKVPNITNTDSCIICDYKTDTIKYIADFIASLTCSPYSDSVTVVLLNTTKILSGYPIPSYAWSYNGNPVFSTAANTSINLAPGTYTFSLLVNGNCLKTITVNIPALPKAKFTSRDTVCVNTPIAFTNTSTGVYSNLIWSFGDGATSLVNNPIKTYSLAGNYNVWLKITNSFGCQDSFLKIITVMPNTLLLNVVPTGPLTFCEGGSVQLNGVVSGGYPGYSFIWSNTLTTQNITVSYTGQYYFDVTDTFGCYLKSNSVNVMVNPKPKPSINGPLIICLGTNPTYSVNYPSTPYVIEWSLDGAATPWYNQSTYNIFGLTVGPHILTVSVMSPDSCWGYDTIKFKVFPLPNVNVGPAANLCEGVPNLIVGSSTSTNILTYFWNTGSNNDSIYASVAGNYIFTVVDSNGCKNTAFKVVHPLPDFCGLLTGCYDICDTVTSLVWFAPKGYASYQWYYNNVAIPWAVSDTFHIPLYQSGSYTLQLTTIYGCTKTSPAINIKFIKCGNCISQVRGNATCGPIDSLGNQTYNFTMQIFNNLSAGANLSITSPNGSVTGITPNTLALGLNNVTFTFTDLPAIDTVACFNVLIFNLTTDCDTTICIKLPICEKPCNKKISWKKFECAGKDGAGNPLYNICVDVFWGGSNGSTLTISTPTGSFTPNPVTINNGNQTVCYTYTDLPPATGFSTFYFTFFDPVTKSICRDSLKRDYSPCPDTCRISVLGLCPECEKKDTSGDSYTIQLTINNTLGAPAAVSVLPVPYGTFGTPSPAVANPGINMINIPFKDNNPRDSIICFRIYLTLNNKICWQDVCVYLPKCDSMHSAINAIKTFTFFSVAPNPAKETVHITYNNADNEVVVIEILDVSGKRVSMINAERGTGETDIDLSSLYNGTYYVSMRSNGVYRGSVKLLIEK